MTPQSDVRIIERSDQLADWGVRPEAEDLVAHVLAVFGPIRSRVVQGVNHAFRGDPADIGPMYCLDFVNTRLSVLESANGQYSGSSYCPGSARRTGFQSIASFISQLESMERRQIFETDEGEPILGPMTPEKWQRGRVTGNVAVFPATGKERAVCDAVGAGWRIRVPHDRGEVTLAQGIPHRITAIHDVLTERDLLHALFKNYSRFYLIQRDRINNRLGWLELGLEGENADFYSYFC